MRYGVPYQGSKNKIAEWVVQSLPRGGTLVDLFAGGCAITHAAMLTNKWQRFIINDLDGDGITLFADAVAGKYADERRWISHEDFFALKESDPYVSLCWSFGNSKENYMYSREIEPWKKALHYARVLGDFSLLREFGVEGGGSRRDIVAHKEEYREKYIRWWLSQQDYTSAELDELIASTKADIARDEEELRQYLLSALRDSGLTQREVGKRLGTQMERHYFWRSQWAFPTEEHYKKMQTFMPLLTEDYNAIVGLYRLRQSLQSLERLESYKRDYREVPIPDDAIIYCDIPYINTKAPYVDGFNHAEFYEWASRQTHPVVVSEYTMPEPDFVCVAERQRVSGASRAGSSMTTERLYVPRHQEQLYNQLMNKPITRTLFDL